MSWHQKRRLISKSTIQYMQQSIIFILSFLYYGNGTQAKSCLKSMVPHSYEDAMQTYPTLQTALETVAKQPIARWYTDRTDDTEKLAKEVYLNVCDSLFASLDVTLGLLSISATISSFDAKVVVVYGLPNKDCEAKFSSSGSNKNAHDYKAFIQTLLDANVNGERVVYLLEPDAVGLLAAEGCGTNLEYESNLAVAIDLLSSSGSDIYLDVGYWKLSNDDDARAVAKIVNSVDRQGKCKGIVLNTANYRSASEMNDCCRRFQRVSDKMYTCIIDTSRNYLPPSNENEWCNTINTGIGPLPTTNTGYDALDAFIWVKPAGESDGECTGRTKDSMQGGPSAGKFFAENFVHLWNNGVFVAEYDYPKVSFASSWAPVDSTKKVSATNLSTPSTYNSQATKLRGEHIAYIPLRASVQLTNISTHPNLSDKSVVTNQTMTRPTQHKAAIDKRNSC